MPKNCYSSGQYYEAYDNELNFCIDKDFDEELGLMNSFETKPRNKRNEEQSGVLWKIRKLMLLQVKTT